MTAPPHWAEKCLSQTTFERVKNMKIKTNIRAGQGGADDTASSSSSSSSNSNHKQKGKYSPVPVSRCVGA